MNTTKRTFVVQLNVCAAAYLEVEATSEDEAAQIVVKAFDAPLNHKEMLATIDYQYEKPDGTIADIDISEA